MKQAILFSAILVFGSLGLYLACRIFFAAFFKSFFRALEEVTTNNQRKNKKEENS